MKKSVIFVALLAGMFFVSCKNSADVKPEETTTETIMEEQMDSVATDSIKADEVAPMGVEKDTLTKK
ncbi:entericidin [Flavobacterium suncheonense]|uniref:entericidin n=1 Tax=Flavobacterium suncheonense TaxID=350894 RepID=UPI00040D9963|nr:entericidin [Flavobacterium suncheonense]